MTAAGPPAIPVPTPSYRCRRNMLEDESSYRLAPDALEIAGAVQRLPYRDVAELRLSYEPTRVDTRRHRSMLTDTQGRRVILVSTSYRGLGDFEDRAESYTPFVRELIRRIGQASPRCRFLAGKPPAMYIAEHAFLLVMLLLAIAVLAAIGGLPIAAIIVLKLIVIVCYLPVAWRYARRNRPRSFAPDAIPPDLLP